MEKKRFDVRFWSTMAILILIGLVAFFSLDAKSQNLMLNSFWQTIKDCWPVILGLPLFLSLIVICCEWRSQKYQKTFDSRLQARSNHHDVKPT